MVDRVSSYLKCLLARFIGEKQSAVLVMCGVELNNPVTFESRSDEVRYSHQCHSKHRQMKYIKV